MWMTQLEECLCRNYLSFYGVSSRDTHSVSLRKQLGSAGAGWAALSVFVGGHMKFLVNTSSFLLCEFTPQ